MLANELNLTHTRIFREKYSSYRRFHEKQASILRLLTEFLELEKQTKKKIEEFRQNSANSFAPKIRRFVMKISVISLGKSNLGRS